MADSEKSDKRIFDPQIVELAKKFKYGECHSEDDAIKYRFFIPEIKPGEVYPLVIFLHGGGECGDDNELQVIGSRGASAYSCPESQAIHPCFILAPQSPADTPFTAVAFEKPFMQLLQEFIRSHPVDTSRVYITGMSMGGIGTWYYISKYPELFAAAVPLCGGGDPYSVKNAKNVPVWAFHSADDPIVPIDSVVPSRPDGTPEIVSTRRMVEALRACGGTVRFTEYPEGYICEKYNLPKEFGGHFSWEPAYQDKELREWLFSQSRANHDEVEFIKPGVWSFNDYCNDSYYMIEGLDKALVIDTGMGKSNILPFIRTLTDKKLELAVTHAHGDHMMHADEFGTVYMPAGEKEHLDAAVKNMMPGKVFDKDNFHWIKDCDVIDLGGGVTVEAASLGGHTQGSTIYIDRAHKCLFAGDAIGSGIFVLMSIPGTLSVSQYKSELDKFYARSAEFDDFSWYGGHRRQERGMALMNPYISLSEQPMSFNPLHRKTVLDMSILCSKLLSGELEGSETSPFGNFGQNKPVYWASYGSVSMMYFKSQLE